MPSAAWWALHAVQDAALAAAMALAFSASRRVGGHTPYGQMLFLLASGFWFLLLGDLVFLARQGLDAFGGPGGFPDALQLPGWALLAASIGLFVVRFSPVGGAPWRRSMLLYVAGSVGLVLAVFRLWLSPPGADPDAGIRAAYLFVDGLALGFIVGGLDRFRRLQRSALGRLYILLGAAVAVKSAGDLYWAYLAARDATSTLATASYPVAGGLAVVGLALHHRDVRHESLEGAPPGTPWMRAEQIYLREVAVQLHALAGGYAARTYLHACGQALDAHGVTWHVAGSTLAAEAPAYVWAQALARGDAFARRSFGVGARDALASVRDPPEAAA